MKKIALSIMAAGITFWSMAQTTVDSTDKKYYHKEHKQELKDKMAALNLTEDQKAQVKEVNKDFAKKFKDLKGQGSMTNDEQRTQRQMLLKEHREKLEAILTPEQRTKAADLFEEGHKEMGKRGERFDRMTKDLNLTPDQSTKMEALNGALKTNIKGIRDNSTLSQDQKKAQIVSLMKQHKADMEALLTEEQREQLKNNMKNRTPKAV